MRPEFSVFAQPFDTSPLVSARTKRAATSSSRPAADQRTGTKEKKKELGKQLKQAIQRTTTTSQFEGKPPMTAKRGFRMAKRKGRTGGHVRFAS